MLKKNTRKRLLAGALATVMMLTMCPSWALADVEDGIAPLPANEEIAVPVDDSTPAADPTKTPDVPSSSEPEVQEPTVETPSAGQDIEESGNNNASSDASEDSKNNSQNNDVVSNSPENEISTASLGVDLASNRNTKAQYFVLLPNRDKPTSGKSQGRASYLPNKTSDGGVTGRNAEKGYEGYLTPEGKKIAKDNYNIHDAKNGYTKIDGVESEYLEPPTNLGFFTKANWSEDGKKYNEKSKPSDPFSVLGENFNVNNITVVWYTIKRQIDGYHVDGYVAGVPVKVTYHSNFGDPEQTKAYPATTGDEYEAFRDYEQTGLPALTNYTFDGWYTDPDCTTKYETTTLMTSLDLYAKWTANTPTQPETPAADAMYFVLLPNRGVPKSGESQGWTNYLPNVDSDGGVKGANRATGYKGHLTEAGKKAADKGEFNANGVNPDYLVVPSDLGFFTRANWNGTTYPHYPADKTNTSVDKITELLGTNYNPEIAEVVWYTVKHDDTDGYHVDGYVKNVDVTVTYHSNFGDTEQTKICTATTGKEYKALDYTKTGLPDRTNYTFDGWYTNRDCTEKTAYKTDTLMTSLDLYAKWVPNNFEVSYFYQNDQGTETKFGDTDTYAFDTDVTVRTAHPEKEGYTFKGWKTNNATVKDDGTFTMPEQNVRFDAEFEKNPAKQYTYTVNKHFYNEKGVEVNVVKGEATPAVENTAVSELYKDAAVKQTVDGKTYVYVSGLTTVTDNLEKLTKDVTIDLYYYLNVEGGNDIPDAWEYRLTFKVVNGEWNDGGNADIVTYVQFKDQKTGEAFKDEAVVVPVTRIPAVGDKPNSGYHAGAWDTSPYDNYKVQKDTVFTYTYAKNSSGGHHHRRPTVTIPDDVPTGLNGDDHYAYIVGYPDKTVRPQNGITRAEVATIFFRLLTDETRDANSTKSNSYSDVAAGAWYNHAVSTLSAMGIVKGDSNGKFNPNAPITRAEFAAIAARFDDKANTTTADFSDIASHWAKNEISAASNNGWITGYPDGTFRPDNKITRAEAMTLVNRVLKRLPETAEDLHDDMIKWSDNSDASQWFYLAVQEATNSHYYQTKENQFEKWSKLRDTRDWTELEK